MNWNKTKILYILAIIGFSNLDSNKFYKVITSFEGNKFNLKVVWDWFEKLGTGLESTFVNQNTIYIWSNISNLEQWNDVIDYVKIYK